jgi:hypothetical protein
VGYSLRPATSAQESGLDEKDGKEQKIKSKYGKN